MRRRKGNKTLDLPVEDQSSSSSDSNSSDSNDSDGGTKTTWNVHYTEVETDTIGAKAISDGFAQYLHNTYCERLEINSINIPKLPINNQQSPNKPQQPKPQESQGSSNSARSSHDGSSTPTSPSNSAKSSGRSEASEEDVELLGGGEKKTYPSPKKSVKFHKSPRAKKKYPYAKLVESSSEEKLSFKQQQLREISKGFIPKRQVSIEAKPAHGKSEINKASNAKVTDGAHKLRKMGQGSMSLDTFFKPDDNKPNMRPVEEELNKAIASRALRIANQ